MPIIFHLNHFGIVDEQKKKKIMLKINTGSEDVRKLTEKNRKKKTRTKYSIDQRSESVCCVVCACCSVKISHLFSSTTIQFHLECVGRLFLFLLRYEIPYLSVQRSRCQILICKRTNRTTTNEKKKKKKSKIKANRLCAIIIYTMLQCTIVCAMI